MKIADLPKVTELAWERAVLSDALRVATERNASRLPGFEKTAHLEMIQGFQDELTATETHLIDLGVVLS